MSFPARCAYVCVVFSLLLAACQTPTAVPRGPTAPPPTPSATVALPPFTPFPTRPVVPTFTAPPPTAEPSLFPPVTEKDWVRGPFTATATLIIYSDFQCGSCAHMAGTLWVLQRELSETLRIVFRHYPLTQNDKAQLAAEAAEAAGAQGKFWEMHDLLFFRQDAWYTQTVPVFRTLLSDYARELDLDVATFDAALDAGTYAGPISLARAAAQEIPLPGAPFVLLGGVPYEDQGDANVWVLSTLIRLESLKARQFPGGPGDAIDPLKRYVATLKTTKGDIVLQLYPAQAPLAVNSFVFLARAGWYNGNMFFRVITDTLAVTGDPSNTGFGGPGYFLPDELAPGAEFDAPGWVGLLSTGPDVNGSQFFITLKAMPELNSHYTRFAKVIAGLEVLAQLTPRDPANPAAPPGDVIEEVVIDEIGE